MVTAPRLTGKVIEIAPPAWSSASGPRVSRVSLIVPCAVKSSGQWA